MPAHDLRLLALDGGGVRGLSSLMILEHLMEAVNPDAPPKPCDYFHMIGGTSTGGLIAIMLGRLKMSVADCIDAYVSLSGRIFRKKRHRFSLKGNIKGRFDSKELEQVVKEIVKGQGLQEDALLKDETNNACKVFVCATSKETRDTVCLTSYRKLRGGTDLLDNVKIWEACRATSAASSFFDPIAVGRFGEEFVDGATGANNPVRKVWEEAQLVWGQEPLEGRIKCLVSIGTGVPSLKPFEDNVLKIGKTLVAIATETERTAESFTRDRPLLSSSGRYYRFNVTHGLEAIGLEEADRVKDLAAATRRYVESQTIHEQIQACAGNIAREYFGPYNVAFRLDNVPRVRRFVDRPKDMARLEESLLPRFGGIQRQKIHVLRGLGGIGKTQLAVEFARQHHREYSAVFWLDGRTEESLKRSIANCANGIPGMSGKIQAQVGDDRMGTNALVEDVMGWLARPDNTAWLLIFDNVDRDYGGRGGDSEAYDPARYFSGADHGSVLITTRLAKLEHLGEAHKLDKVSEEQAIAIFESWYKKKHDTTDRASLLERLDGLPLAIAQAGAYLQESGMSLTAYFNNYEQKWGELMSSGDVYDTPLLDYPERSVWTTWTIAYEAIHTKHRWTANLLLLWSYLDNKDVWYGIFEKSCNASEGAANMLSEWIGDIASSEVAFSRAMQLLNNYSLVEKVAESESYSTHPVVHQWAYHHRGKQYAVDLEQLAVITIGWSFPHKLTQEDLAMQRRLLPHARACSSKILTNKPEQELKDTEQCGVYCKGSHDHQTYLEAIGFIGSFHYGQGNFTEAVMLFDHELQGLEAVFGSKHRSTLYAQFKLSCAYVILERFEEAERIITQILQVMDELPAPDEELRLHSIANLGDVYRSQGKLADARRLYEQVKQAFRKTYGRDHEYTLMAHYNLALVYWDQKKLTEAEIMFQQTLQTQTTSLGPNHPSTLSTMRSLGALYRDQGKLEEARYLLQRAVRGSEEWLGPRHSETLWTVAELGRTYRLEGNLNVAESMYNRCLKEFAVMQDHYKGLRWVYIDLHAIYTTQGRSAEAEQILARNRR